MLIKQDSNIAILDVDRKTPLHLAASCQDSQAVDCVRLILVGWGGGGGWQQKTKKNKNILYLKFKQIKPILKKNF